MSTKATQCAKVDCQMAVISAHMRLTSTQSFAILTGLWANEMKAARKVETFDTSSTEAAIRKGPRLIGFVHDEVNGREGKAAFKGKGVGQVSRSWTTHSASIVCECDGARVERSDG